MVYVTQLVQHSLCKEHFSKSRRQKSAFRKTLLEICLGSKYSSSQDLSMVVPEMCWIDLRDVIYIYNA